MQSLVGRIVRIPMIRCLRLYTLYLACTYIPDGTTVYMNRIELRVLPISLPSYKFRRDIWVCVGQGSVQGHMTQQGGAYRGTLILTFRDRLGPFFGKLWFACKLTVVHKGTVLSNLAE